MIYLDSSALVKLVVEEAESGALRAYLRERHGSDRVTSALARVEVVRAVRSKGAGAVALAGDVLRKTDSIPLSIDLLDEAALLADDVLRTLDAIHIASAQRVGPDLIALVAYDRRLVDAAACSGLAAISPH